MGISKNFSENDKKTQNLSNNNEKKQIVSGIYDKINNTMEEVNQTKSVAEEKENAMQTQPVMSLDEFKKRFKMLSNSKSKSAYDDKMGLTKMDNIGKAQNPDVLVIKDEVKKMAAPKIDVKEKGLQNMPDKVQKHKKKVFGGKGIVAVCLAFIITVLVVASVVSAGNVSADNVITANATNTRVVQARLSSLGYFNGEINGVYNQETIEAIKNFQTDKNLSATGSLDSATTVALGVTNNAQANTDLYLLAKLIYSEARGEVYEGQVAVGAVVLNRVADAGFPNTLQGVIYQPWAFTALHDGQFSLEPNGTAYQAAQDAMNGWDPTYGCLYYYNPRTATSSWIFSRQIIVTIGNHVFCV